MERMPPDDEGHVEHLRHRHERLAQLRHLVSEHAAVVHDLQELHAHYLELQRQHVDTTELRAEESELLSAEVLAVERALDLQRAVHDLLSQDQRLLR